MAGIEIREKKRESHYRMSQAMQRKARVYGGPASTPVVQMLCDWLLQTALALEEECNAQIAARQQTTQAQDR
jgi:hypothetical protein